MRHLLYGISALVSQTSLYRKPVEASRNASYFLRLRSIYLYEKFSTWVFPILPLIFNFKNVGINCLAENGFPECASVSLPYTFMFSVSAYTKFTKEN